MKKILSILVALLILAGCSTSPTVESSSNGELESRLAELEKENSELQKKIEENSEIQSQSEPGGKMDEQAAVESQLAIILSTKVIEQSDQYKSLYPDMAQWIMENKSDNVIKNYTVAVLGYDVNGYPVKVPGQYDGSYATYEKEVLAEAVNVQPGEQHGEGYGMQLSKDHQLIYALVLVSEIEFYDADKWENPYYAVWLKKYKEKPVSVDELKAICDVTMAEPPVSASSQSASSTATQSSTPKSPAQYEEEVHYIEDISGNKQSSTSGSTGNAALDKELAAQRYQESYQNATPSIIYEPDEWDD